LDDLLMMRMKMGGNLDDLSLVETEMKNEWGSFFFEAVKVAEDAMKVVEKERLSMEKKNVVWVVFLEKAEAQRVESLCL